MSASAGVAVKSSAPSHRPKSAQRRSPGSLALVTPPPRPTSGQWTSGTKRRSKSDTILTDATSIGPSNDVTLLKPAIVDARAMLERYRLSSGWCSEESARARLRRIFKTVFRAVQEVMKKHSVVAVLKACVLGRKHDQEASRSPSPLPLSPQVIPREELEAVSPLADESSATIGIADRLAQLKQWPGPTLLQTPKLSSQKLLTEESEAFSPLADASSPVGIAERLSRLKEWPSPTLLETPKRSKAARADQEVVSDCSDWEALRLSSAGAVDLSNDMLDSLEALKLRSKEKLDDLQEMKNVYAEQSAVANDFLEHLKDDTAKMMRALGRSEEPSLQEAKLRYQSEGIAKVAEEKARYLRDSAAKSFSVTSNRRHVAPQLLASDADDESDEEDEDVASSVNQLLETFGAEMATVRSARAKTDMMQWTVAADQWEARKAAADEWESREASIAPINAFSSIANNALSSIATKDPAAATPPAAVAATPSPDTLVSEVEEVEKPLDALQQGARQASDAIQKPPELPSLAPEEEEGHFQDRCVTHSPCRSSPAHSHDKAASTPQRPSATYAVEADEVIAKSLIDALEADGKMKMLSATEPVTKMRRVVSEAESHISVEWSEEEMHGSDKETHPAMPTSFCHVPSAQKRSLSSNYVSAESHTPRSPSRSSSYDELLIHGVRVGADGKRQCASPVPRYASMFGNYARTQQLYLHSEVGLAQGAPALPRRKQILALPPSSLAYCPSPNDRPMSATYPPKSSERPMAATYPLKKLSQCTQRSIGNRLVTGGSCRSEFMHRKGPPVVVQEPNPCQQKHTRRRSIVGKFANRLPAVGPPCQFGKVLDWRMKT